MPVEYFEAIMKRSQAYKICRRKKKYTVRAAKRAAQRINELGGREVWDYRCPICGERHVGGNRIKQKGRVPMLQDSAASTSAATS
jgi:hypothetical protein